MLRGVPPKEFGFGDVVGLGIDHNMVHRIERLSRIVRLTAEGGTGIFGREIRSDVGMGMVDHLDRARHSKTVQQEAQIFPAEIVRFSRRTGKPFRVDGVIAVLLILTAAHFVKGGAIVRADEESTALFRVRAPRMGIYVS
jgi:hypothetical protein